MKISSAYLGIDVSKRTLHLAEPTRFLKEFNNSLEGHQTLIRWLAEKKPQLIVLEASGGYERAVCEAMQDAGLPVKVAQPGCVRNFAKSLKVLAKTDEIDAQVIAHFGEATNPKRTPQTPQIVRQLRALCDRRQQIVADRVREGNRLEKCADPGIAEHIEASIQQLRTQEKEFDEQIQALQRSDQDLNKKANAMLAQKGVGHKTVAVLLTHFPELGALDRQQVAALAGLAPYANESGKWKGKRRIFAGRATVRKALFMAARTAVVWCPVIKPFYQRLREAGKPYKVALIAAARKMLIRLNTILKELEPESENVTSAT